MFTRLLMISATLFIVAACSTTEESASGDVAASERELITDAPADVYGQNLNGAAPGTQADLEANIGERVFFGYDRYDLSAEARDVLAAQAGWLQQYPNIYLTIEGHADERGTREYNLALGDRRATSVRDYLVALGVSPNRLSTISYGKERPAVAGSNDQSWAQNRRAVSVVE